MGFIYKKNVISLMEEMSKTVKILLFLVMITFTLVVVTTTKNIFDSSAPEVWNNCVDGGLEQLYAENIIISSADLAADELKSRVGGGPVLVGNSIEKCGVGYVFNSSEGKYLVCEDGTISRYIQICKNDSLYDKGISAVKSMTPEKRNGTSGTEE